jgi:hypothetical protein
MEDRIEQLEQELQELEKLIPEGVQERIKEIQTEIKNQAIELGLEETGLYKITVVDSKEDIDSTKIKQDDHLMVAIRAKGYIKITPEQKRLTPKKRKSYKRKGGE